MFTIYFVRIRKYDFLHFNKPRAVTHIVVVVAGSYVCVHGVRRAWWLGPAMLLLVMGPSRDPTLNENHNKYNEMIEDHTLVGARCARRRMPWARARRASLVLDCVAVPSKHSLIHAHAQRKPIHSPHSHHTLAVPCIAHMLSHACSRTHTKNTDSDNWCCQTC